MYLMVVLHVGSELSWPGRSSRRRRIALAIPHGCCVEARAPLSCDVPRVWPRQGPVKGRFIALELHARRTPGRTWRRVVRDYAETPSICRRPRLTMSGYSRYTRGAIVVSLSKEDSSRFAPTGRR